MWLLGPTTNVSMSCRSFGRTVRLLSGAEDSAGMAGRPPAGLMAGGIVLIGWLTATALRVGRTVGDPSITGDIGRWCVRDLSACTSAAATPWSCGRFGCAGSD